MLIRYVATSVFMFLSPQSRQNRELDLHENEVCPQAELLTGEEMCVWPKTSEIKWRYTSDPLWIYSATAAALKGSSTPNQRDPNTTAALLFDGLTFLAALQASIQHKSRTCKRWRHCFIYKWDNVNAIEVPNHFGLLPFKAAQSPLMILCHRDVCL